MGFRNQWWSHAIIGKNASMMAAWSLFEEAIDMPKMPKMPIDVMAVLQEATDVEAARSVPLCVSVLLDDTAPDDLTAFVRSSFASASMAV